MGSSIFVFGGRMGTSIDEKLLDDLWVFDADAKVDMVLRRQFGDILFLHRFSKVQRVPKTAKRC